MKYRCLIVDDEPLAHTILKEYIQSNDILEVSGQCFSAEEARNYFSENEVDILFLDIEMPEENGISFLTKLNNKPITIFTTAYLNYTLDAYDLGVLDYLVKPIRKERFEKAVNRAIEFLELQALKSGLVKENEVDSQILIKTGTKKILLERESITHVQALKDYMIIHCGDKRHVIRSTMKDMEELLGTKEFIRVHKSFIVAKHKIQYVTSSSIEFNQYEIPIGRKYKDEVDNVVKR